MNPATVLMQRLWTASRLPAQAAPTTRLQVCPPEAWPSRQGWMQRMARRLRSGLGAGALSQRQVNRLAEAQQDYQQAIADVHTRAADELRLRVTRARSLRELWHQRAPVFVLLARVHGEAEAERRLAHMNRFFPTRAPRSGFASFQEHA